MSKPRYGWWGYVKDMIRRYPNGCNDDERSAVQAAVEQTTVLCDGADRLKVINLVYFQKIRTLSGAAAQIPCSYETAKRWQQQFIKAVAANFRCKGLKD